MVSYILAYIPLFMLQIITSGGGGRGGPGNSDGGMGVPRHYKNIVALAVLLLTDSG